MPKKLTLEYIKKYVEEFGYECLSDIYVNAHTKLKFRCNNGHIYEAVWTSFQQRERCPVCAAEKRGDSYRLTLEYVRARTKEIAEGYECIDDKYINANSKLKFVCNHNHEFMMRWGNFSNLGNRCPHCFSIARKNSSRKLSIEYVREKTHELAEGYECLSDEYVNASSKLKFRCNNGHIYEVAWNSLQRGFRCSICAGNVKKNIEEVKKYIEGFGYKCLSNKYIGVHSKLKLVCDRGHSYKVTLGNFQFGRRCPICAIENKSGENNYNWKNYTSEDRKNFILYRSEVRQLTEVNYTKYFSFVNPNKLGRSSSIYHLDHIYSVIDGFNNSVLPEIIASPVNLQMLWHKDNESKHSNSDITLEQLYDLHNQFITSIGSEK